MAPARSSVMCVDCVEGRGGDEGDRFSDAEPETGLELLARTDLARLFYERALAEKWLARSRQRAVEELVHFDGLSEPPPQRTRSRVNGCNRRHAMAVALSI